MPTLISVSIPTFHELSQKLEEKGVKLNDKSEIILTKDTSLERPIDWRLVQVRKDCVIEATKSYRHIVEKDGEFELANSTHFLNYVEDIFNFVLNGTKPKSTKSEWK